VIVRAVRTGKPISQDAPIESPARKQQGFADKYNQQQFIPGKTRMKSSQNLRFPTRFSGLLAGRAIGSTGTSTMSTFGAMMQLGY
jgi:hypothetical protein